MERITFSEMEKRLFKYNCDHPETEDDAVVSAVVVFKQSNWDKPYSELSRSYRVWNNNRAFQPNKIAHSIFSSCLDGTDIGVRLDWCNWEVEYCYMESDIA